MAAGSFGPVTQYGALRSPGVPVALAGQNIEARDERRFTCSALSLLLLSCWMRFSSSFPVMPVGCCTRPRTLPQIPERVRDLWRRLEALPPSDPLPADLPAVLYGTEDGASTASTAPTLLGSTLQCAMYAQLLQPYLARFPPDRWLGVGWMGQRLGRTGGGQDGYRTVTS